MFQKFNDLKATLMFFRHNPHSIPGIRDLLCKMGRHDYEAISLSDFNLSGCILECFYCQRRKTSHFP